MKKKFMLFTGLGLAVAGLAFVGFGVSAASTYAVVEDYGVYTLSEDGTYTVEEMLVSAIQDEYLAQATYAAIIDAYGEIKPFTKIILAEQTHIDLLLPLFAAYGIEVPVNDAAQYVVLPDSISSALSTGVQAETLNIAMYDAFLSQVDLPADVQTVFEYLQAASENHLAAFSKDRLVGAGYDLGNMIKNQFKKGGNSSSQRGNSSVQRGTNDGVCVND
ncbi:MAG: hypothetical protein A2013_04380 [Tenericutes bacterium GWE2_38_8]|nr:MAG: hypothetical protein A2013_04380 [Tenericutes bacterium GWE2_38_8]